MIRVGMIGAGNFATVHLRALAQEPDVEIVGHVSASGQRAQANALAYGGSAFAGVEAFVDEAHPDAVWICTPPDAHGPIEDVLMVPGSTRPLPLPGGTGPQQVVVRCWSRRLT